MATKAAARCVLGVAEESRVVILALKLAKIGARVGPREARNTNPSSSMVDGVPVVDGLVHAAGPAVSATMDEISSFFDLEHNFWGLV